MTAGSMRSSCDRRPNKYFSDIFRVHSSSTSVALIVYFSTSKISNTNRAGYLVAGPVFGCTSPAI